ncbi:hypothetical protein SAMN04515619_107155 [Collimonas sp. OK412]|jgi:hypothetical protein|nr:hypothetical protein SAMN04515619_107155 [Collimonas sp. OK412]
MTFMTQHMRYLSLHRVIAGIVAQDVEWPVMVLLHISIWK